MQTKPSVNIVIPVFNEEKDLEKSISTLHAFLTHNLKNFLWDITIVDNASLDQTMKIARKLQNNFKRLKVIHLDKKGRGRAVKFAWKNSNHDLLCYMDVDLSTDLKHLNTLFSSLLRGYDIAIGTRNLSGARVYGRSLLRNITSLGYIMLIKLFFWVGFSDAQCGFKAVTRQVVNNLLHNIKDDGWFFDSELLIVAERLGYRIYEEPVTWIDNPGSTVRVWKTALGDVEGLLRLFVERPWHKLKYARK